MREQALRLPPQADLIEILTGIGECYTVRDAGEEPVTLIYYDTFDWRLATTGLSLWRRGSRFHLAARHTAAVLAGGVGTRHSRLLVGHLPPGDLQQQLRPVVKERALLARFTLSGTFRRFDLLNEDQKTVLRLKLIAHTGQLADQRFALDRLLVVEVLRGYDDCWTAVRPLLTAMEIEEVAAGYDPVGMVHAALHIDPAEVSAKFDFMLSGTETVYQAVSDICLYLLRKIQINIAGILDDIDVEFLHDLRVNVRRTRSLLALLKKYLPQKEMAWFQQELKWVGMVTGPVRDLDVYLLKEEEFARMLPEVLHAGLPFFFEDLRQSRQREVKRLRQQLRSPRFKAFLSEWRTFLQCLPERRGSQGRSSIREVARDIIARRLQRMVDKGRSITSDTPDENVHALRIEGKKFRYLLEFFRSLHAPELVDEYLKQMKKLQNVLGDFNDCSVQKQMLVKHLQQLDPLDMHGRSTAAALGGLIVHLDEEQRRLRASFDQVFSAFATEENLAIIERILAPVAENGDEEESG